MERQPRTGAINNILGPRDAAIRAAMKSWFENLYVNYADSTPAKEYKALERPKTLDDLYMIALADRMTNQMLANLGLKPIDISPDVVHILPADKYQNKHHDGSAGIFDPSRQNIAVANSSSSLGLMREILHETLHFKSYNSILVDKVTGRTRSRTYRTGFAWLDLKANLMRMKWFNEAITEDLTWCLMRNLLRDPFFIPEIKKHQETLDVFCRARREPRLRLLIDDVCFVQSDLNGVNVLPVIYGFTYREERAITQLLLSKLWARNSIKYLSPEMLILGLVRDSFSGNLARLGKLLDITYGKGTFRTLAELGWDMKQVKALCASL